MAILRHKYPFFLNKRPTEAIKAHSLTLFPFTDGKKVRKTKGWKFTIRCWIRTTQTSRTFTFAFFADAFVTFLTIILFESKMC
jgi:hypothetical protein